MLLLPSKFYKIRHKPTGLFFTPNTTNYGMTKNNLSKKGKVYGKKPSLKWLPDYISDGTLNENRRNNTIKVIFSDFEIVEYSVTETNIYQYESEADLY